MRIQLDYSWEIIICKLKDEIFKICPKSFHEILTLRHVFQILSLGQVLALEIFFQDSPPHPMSLETLFTKTKQKTKKKNQKQQQQNPVQTDRPYLGGLSTLNTDFIFFCCHLNSIKHMQTCVMSQLICFVQSPLNSAIYVWSLW